MATEERVLRTLGQETMGTALRLRREPLGFKDHSSRLRSPFSRSRSSRTNQDEHFAILQHKNNEVEMLHDLTQHKVYDTKVLHDLVQEILRNLSGMCPNTSTS